ncbi:MAG: DUF1257 domain-containing protein [Planctomycetota bacterium]|nr:MAG: DUF1257 domain-containing protein [Planctomycetota bacterium]REK25961.1 MAG: DUF1257 domain-containing protein [Planctomycetota bacterium]REK46923.1 MAG: DUF1257 domain-containing protein [Planctomycetota bacterium]
MSHFTNVKTQLVNLEYLKKSLTDLGYAYEEGNVEISGYRGKRAGVELRIPTNSPGYDIGFRKGSSGYDMIADWWGISDIDKRSFLQQIGQRYAYNATRDKLEKQGFSIAEEKVNDEGKIHLVLRRMI